MATVAKTIPEVKDFIKKWEGKPKYNSAGNMVAFDDGYGTPTIGWGATYYKNGQSVKMGDVITPQEGIELYDYHIQLTADGIARVTDISVYNEKQFAALISYAFTTGVTGLRNYGLLDLIEKGVRGDDLRAFWIKSAVTSKGKFSQGLVNRRKDEFTLFNNSYSPAYSYYLRNEDTINKTALYTAGAIAVAMSAYIYFVIKKNKG